MKLNVTQTRSLWWSISAGILAIGLIAMIISWTQIGTPLRPSIDFVGGTRIQLQRDCSQPDACTEPIGLSEVRDVLSSQGLANSSIQIVGQDQQSLSIRTKTLDVDQRTRLLDALTESIGTFTPETSQIDTVGPVIGREIFTSGLLALGVAFLGITIYLSVRFQTDYAVFALVALVHDVLIVMGLFAILGLALAVEVDSLFIVALLTVVGFSVNDTVVIYDRIRETLKYNPGMPIDEVIDAGVNQSLTRSINTTVTTILSLVAIVLFGGETLKFFALALIVGFISGAYSSIFIASTLFGWWRERHPAAVAPEAALEEDASPAPEVSPIIEADFVDATGTPPDSEDPGM